MDDWFLDPFSTSRDSSTGIVDILDRIYLRLFLFRHLGRLVMPRLEAIAVRPWIYWRMPRTRSIWLM